MRADMEADTLVDDDLLLADDPWALDHLDGGAPPPPEDPAARALREGFVRQVVDALVLVSCVLFVFANIHPAQVLSSAVPSGGDMGAHVWGPAFLRDHLLPHGRLSGWTPDWYAGFPAYQFYMVVPSLLIVALDVGIFGGWTMLLPLALCAALVVRSRRVGPGWPRWGVVAAASVVVLGGVELPYGTAFKLVTVLGVLALPLCVYAFGRLADLPYPAPPVLAVAAVLFLFDRNFTIYGGNIASSLAGEFAFSISLSLAVLYLGVVTRGLRTGRHRASAAVLLALTGLCHLIPAFFALVGTVMVALLRRPARRTLTWLACVLPVGALISAFWVAPFYWQRAYVNDMGWEKLPASSVANGHRALSKTLFTWNGDTYWKYLVPRTSAGSPSDLRWVLALACMGLVLSVAAKLRAGLVLAALAVSMALAFVFLPEARLWNARLLPFYYLCLYLLAAVGVAEIGRTLAILSARDPDRPSIVGGALTASLSLVLGLVAVGLPLRSLPLGRTHADGSYSWLGLHNGVNQSSFVPSWANWNYTGYEGKDAYPEYRNLIRTMAKVGAEHGCGRSFWEYQNEINRYGTPMALMLLPHWTNGCIGSEEGLFFEASATTPFHFLTQVELSAAPSAAQRDLPYGSFDIDKGVHHLQLMGVRYFLTTSVKATTAARGQRDLTELATSGPWVIFEVAHAELVEPLHNEPAVLTGIHDAQADWICRTRLPTGLNGKCEGPAIAWFLDPPAQQVFLASSGPAAWQRVDPDHPTPALHPEPAVEVTHVQAGTDRVAFDVDRTGAPVLVKTSYFPNWHATGADGPYRVTPNFMVVVPTAKHVELSYGREPVDWIGYALTALGIALAALLATRPPLRRRRRRGVDAKVAHGPPPRHFAR